MSNDGNRGNTQLGQQLVHALGVELASVAVQVLQCVGSILKTELGILALSLGSGVGYRELRTGCIPFGKVLGVCSQGCAVWESVFAIHTSYRGSRGTASGSFRSKKSGARTGGWNVEIVPSFVSENGVLVEQLVVSEREGVGHVGDTVEVLSWL